MRLERVARINRARQGRREALVSLIMDYKDDYYRLAYVLTGNPHDAADALEDMIVIVYEKMQQLKDPDKFDSWSRTILRNCCRKILRSRSKTVPSLTLPEKDTTNEPDTETAIVIENGIRRLDDKYQDVIRMRYFLDYDYQTVADILKIPLGTVKSRLANGLSRLKFVLGGDWSNDS